MQSLKKHLEEKLLLLLTFEIYDNTQQDIYLSIYYYTSYDTERVLGSVKWGQKSRDIGSVALKCKKNLHFEV